MNISVLVGRLTKDPDLRYTPAGHAVANFTLAVDRPFAKDETDFINCVAWRKQAENLANYMKKGSQVGISGRIQTRNYEDKDGKRVYVTEVVADNIQFLESKQSSNKQSDPYTDYAKKQQGQPMDIKDSDLPF